MKRIPTVILGAGPTGLGAAFRLSELRKADFAIFERHSYVGGHTASFVTPEGFTFDEGGHVLFSHYPYFDRVVDRLLKNQLRSHNRDSWVWISGRWVRYPFQEHLFHLPPDMAYECIAGLIEVSANGQQSPSNFREWIEASFGSGIANLFMIPYNEKAWAHPLELMDYGWIGERVATIDLRQVIRRVLIHEESAWGPNSTFSYPLRGGFGAVSTAIAQSLDPQTMHLGLSAVSINPDNRTVLFQNGATAGYEHLISTLPLPVLARALGSALPDTLRRTAQSFLRNGVFVVGIGVRGRCPSTRHWVYFPEARFPFHRVTFLSNYSPHVVPADDMYSLLVEISFSAHRPLDRRHIVANTIERLEELGFLLRERIVSLKCKGMSYAYPLPFLGRDQMLERIHSFLEVQGIYSRGRFGGWRYEVGNTDHSFMQGVEVAERIVTGKTEEVYVRL